jgi:hypothetical protein
LVGLVDRELKFFLTSPVLVSLELFPVLSLGILKIIEKHLEVIKIVIIPDNLLAVVWLMLIFYSTYFELEVWRKSFLNRGTMLKVYTISSPYAPFLKHSVVSLVLLEFKTLVFLLSMLLPSLIISQKGLDFLQMAAFLVATHVNWLFSLSLGNILSREVFNNLPDSAAMFLCILIFNTITVLMISQNFSQGVSLSLTQFWLMPSLEKGLGDITTYLPAILFSIVLYIVATLLNNRISRSIRIDGF